MTQRTNLRASLSSFVGREAELDRVADLLGSSRLTTIVGPGGAGKTRLATHAARPWVDRTRAGVWLVELASVTEESSLPTAVLSALGLQANSILERRDLRPGTTPTERLIAILADSDVLLVVDNCEHLIGGVADLVAEILQRCPAVRVLATSREPLGMAGEALCAIPPLGLPPPGASAAVAAGYPAVHLLLARGAAAQAGFALTDLTAEPIVQVVRRLDGLPLAIELAAARLRVLPITEIAARLDDRFRLLAGGVRTAVARHRTLRAVVEWSWDLLEPPERLLAERLAVFPAGATVEAAVAVCGFDALSPGDIPDLLLALVDKSLLAYGSNDGGRYRMLETIREYGVERLDERDELGAAREAHAHYFAGLAHELDPQLRSQGQLAALATFVAERDNMLAALRFLGDSGSGPQTLSLVHDLGWFWNVTGNHADLTVWTQFALDRTEGTDSPQRAGVEASQLLAVVSTGAAKSQDEWERLQGRLTAAGAKLAAVDDGTDPTTLIVRLVSAFFLGARGDIEQLIAVGRQATDPWVRATILATHVMFLENYGDVDGMRDEVEEAHDLFRTIGDRWGMSNTLAARASIRAMDGDVDGAAADYELALTCLHELGSTEDDVMIRLRLAGLRLRQGDFAAARAEVALARTGPDGRPPDIERVLIADTASIAITLEEGDVDAAARHAAELRLRVASSEHRNPIFHHLIALTGAVCAVAAIRSGDLATAATDLLPAYRSGVESDDRPVLAGVAVAIAVYAQATGQPSESAEILGAAARLRGSGDEHDVQIARLRSGLIKTLGSNEFEAAYGAGRSLSPDAASKRVDPTPLLVRADDPIDAQARLR